MSFYGWNSIAKMNYFLQMDVLNKQERSRLMAKVRSRGNASTELRMAAFLRQHNITGWRRHCSLVGRPDFIFRSAKLAVFVDGCFWHGCPRCYRAPKSARAYWRQKVCRNKKRDSEVTRALRKRGWKVVRVWECQLASPKNLMRLFKKDGQLSG